MQETPPFFTPDLEQFLRSKRVYTKALKYTKETYKHFERPRSLKKLTGCFVFSSTPEGYDFWEKIHFESCHP